MRLEELKSTTKTIKSFLKLTSKMSKGYIGLVIINAVITAVMPLINIVMPKFLIDELIGLKRMDVLIKLVLIIVITNMVVSLLCKILGALIESRNLNISKSFDAHIGNIIMELDFEKVEDSDILDLKEKALFSLKNQNVVNKTVNGLVKIISNMAIIISLLAVILTLDAYIILIILCMIFLSKFIYKGLEKARYDFFQKVVHVNREYIYLSNISNDFSIGKDIRLYDSSQLIIDKVKATDDKNIEYGGQFFKTVGKYTGLSSASVQIQNIVIYSYMIYKFILRSITLGEFTMYIGATNKFSSCISEMVKTFIELKQMSKYLENYFTLETIYSETNMKGINIDKENLRCEIEFKNVFFKYPKSQNYTLEDVSLTIKAGEKLSIVGENGAGKTTFIKLLTRLYKPTQGEILLNGINIEEYDCNDYMNLLSVIFQDFKMFAFSIKENIALSKEADDVELFNILSKCKMEEDVKKLDRNLNTSIYKVFDKDGIELSGGQSQKIAIARAIFKDSPIVILDEPTSALDPISESEIYEQFNDVIGNKTAIYISHRLSSCKFCDNIAVFHKGSVVEYGNHEKLMKISNGRYKNMYEVQAQYYG